MPARRFRSSLTALVLVGLLVGAQAQDFNQALNKLARDEIAAIATDPILIAAIVEQNAITAGYDQGRIDALDRQWRAEVGAASKPLIDATLAKPVSRYLSGLQNASAGKFTEIFVIDARGLNVAQSALTSDYWQGDEDKFTRSFGAGAGAVHIGAVEQDESTQVFQSQVSLPVSDPVTGDVIGAISIGVDVSML